LVLNIEVRYPTYRDELFSVLSKEYYQELLEETKELSEWIKGKL
jgi:hypothetical protein